MVTTNSEDVIQYLRPGVFTDVREGRDLVFTATRHEVIALLNAGVVRCNVYKDKRSDLVRITHAILTGTRQAAQRVITPLGIVRTSANITKARQSNGAKHWVTRLDRAECGIGGGASRVVFPLAFRSVGTIREASNQWTERGQLTERREVA